jgi:hypothetical protein
MERENKEEKWRGRIARENREGEWRGRMEREGSCYRIARGGDHGVVDDRRLGCLTDCRLDSASGGCW